MERLKRFHNVGVFYPAFRRFPDTFYGLQLFNMMICVREMTTMGTYIIPWGGLGVLPEETHFQDTQSAT